MGKKVCAASHQTINTFAFEPNWGQVQLNPNEATTAVHTYTHHMDLFLIMWYAMAFHWPYSNGL